MAAENLYIGGGTGGGGGVFAPYSPATFKGSWDVTPTVADRLLSRYKVGSTTEATRAEAVSTTPYRVCVVRFISQKLGTGTVAGTLDIVLGLRESNAAADFYTKIYAYITQGDSDSVRGVVLDYEETSAGGATEWPTTSTGRALQAAQALAAINYQEGDRLVIEFGYRSENSSTTSRTGGVRLGGCGGLNQPIEPNADLTVGSTSVTSRAGYFALSDALTWSTSEPTNLDITNAIDVSALPYDSGNFAVVSSTYALFWKYTATGSEQDHVVNSFAGVSDNSGIYIPQALIYEYTGTQMDLYGSGIGVIFGAYQVPVTGGRTYYWQVLGTPFSAPPTGDPGRDLRFTVVASPTPPGDLTNAYLITADLDDSFVNFAHYGVVLDPDTGTIIAQPLLVRSEHGVVLDNAIFALEDLDAGEVVIYNADMSVRATTSGVGLAGSTFIAVCTDGTSFYCVQRQNSLAQILVSKVDEDANILQQWSLPIPVGWSNVWAAGVSRDGGTLFYTSWDAGADILAWDLTGNVSLGTWLAGDSATEQPDIFVMRDDTVMVMRQPSPKTIPLAMMGTVNRYDLDANLLQSYTFSDPFTGLSGYSVGRAIIDHIASTPEDPDKFFIWFQYQYPTADYSAYSPYSYKAHSFALVDTATNALSKVIPPEAVPNFVFGSTIPFPDADLPTQYFGALGSCPPIVFGARTVVTTATLIVVKETVPGGSLQEFSFTVNPGLSPATFDLADGESMTYEDVTPGTYSVEEDPVDGWDTSYDVSNADPHDAIVLAAGDTVTVTVTNTQQTPEECPGETGDPITDGVSYTPPTLDPCPE